MAAKAPQDHTVVELKSKLKALGENATGSKAELIARLFEVDPSGSWTITKAKGNHGDPMCGVGEGVESSVMEVKSGTGDGSQATGSMDHANERTQVVGDAWRGEGEARAIGDAWRGEGEARTIGDAWRGEGEARALGGAWRGEGEARAIGDAWRGEGEARAIGDAWRGEGEARAIGGAWQGDGEARAIGGAWRGHGEPQAIGGAWRGGSEALAARDAEIRMLRREKELVERELALMRRMQQLNMTQSAHQEAGERGENPPMRITPIIEMLGHYDGKSETYERWESHVCWLRNTYDLSERDTKSLIVARLRGRAMDWFQSKAEYITLPCKQLLEEIKAMFHKVEEKAVRRAKFEKRIWRSGETFQEYFHEKVILANRVPIDEEEMVANLIEGIPDPDLRERAAMHRFESKAALLAAFRIVAWRSGAGRTMNAEPTGEKPRREAGVSKNSAATQRCKSCGSRNHVISDCPTRHRGPKCFECQDFGHVSTACPRKKDQQSQPRVTYITSESGDNKFRKDVKIGEMKIAALLDTGSDLCLMRASKHVEIGAPPLQRREIKFRGIGPNISGQTLGEFNTSVIIDGDEYSMRVRVVPDDTMHFELLIGADFLRTVETHIRENNVTIRKIEESDKRIEVPRVFCVECETNAIELDIASGSHRKAGERDMIESDKPTKERDARGSKSILLKNDKPAYEKAEKQEVCNRRKEKASRYSEDDLVAIRRTQMQPGLKFAAKYLGPYAVTKVLRNDRYLVKRIGEHEGPGETSTRAEHMKRWMEDDEKEEDSDCESDGDT